MVSPWNEGLGTITNGDVPNEGQARELIRKRAEQLVERVIDARGHEEPPYLPSEYGPLLNVTKIETANLGTTDGFLLPLRDGYKIKLNATDHWARRNFTCAHEMGHILFDGLGLREYVRRIEYRTYNPHATIKMRASIIERLCDAAAAQLLMPTGVFRKHLGALGVGVHAVEPLADLFKVSAQTAAMRIAEVANEHCAALFWRPWPRNGKPRGLKTSRVTSNPENAPCRPVRTLVKRPSSLHTAFDTDKVVSSSRTFVTQGAVRRVSMQSKGFGRGEYRYVLSLAFPER